MTVKRVSRPTIKTAKVKLLKGVILGPGQRGREGEIYEVPKHQASQLVNFGQAEYTDEGEASEHDDAGAKTHREGFNTVTLEQPENRDPKPKRKG
jgi:hypothetical protein